MTNDTTPLADERPPLSRAEQQERTAAALLSSARAVFARDGFHGARLDAIAHRAGLTKGAIYSNFDGKAELFLAILEADLAQLDDVEAWDPAERFALLDTMMADGAPLTDLPEDLAEELGIGLATLEFGAYAARDPDLRVAFARFQRRLRDAFRTVALRHHHDDDELTADQLAVMLMAFDHGAMITWLAGVSRIDHTMATQAYQRMLQPIETAADAP